MVPAVSFRPRLISALAGYDRARFTQDLGAGLTVAVVALPLAMAFAIASGLKPEAGLFTAIIAGFIISALGGSRVQIGGPAGAFIVIVYGIVQQYGVANLILATTLSGLILLAMGVFRLGTLIRFIPVAVIIGFTNGIAVLIALSQIKDFLGLTIPKMPGEFFGILHALGTHLNTLNPWALGVALGSLVIVVGWQRWAKKVPVIGPILFGHDPILYLGIAIVAGVWALLKYTRAGLILRAVGESHDAAHALGYKVVRIRTLSILFGGAACGSSRRLIFTPVISPMSRICWASLPMASRLRHTKTPHDFAISVLFWISMVSAPSMARQKRFSLRRSPGSTEASSNPG